MRERLNWAGLAAAVLLGGAFVLLIWSTFAKDPSLTAQAGVLAVIGIGAAVLSLHER